MKILMSAILASLVFGAYAFAEDVKENVTPFGATCRLCGEYGYCKKEAKHEEAVKALEKYYKENDMSVVVKKKEGRFMEAEVYKGDELVDKVVLDCKTGKIRSIK